MANQLEDSIQCSTCLDIFKDPVILPCSHSFCRTCLQQWKQKGDGTCPLCRTQYSSMDAHVNFALRNVCEAFSHTSLASEGVCSLHKETQKLFCLDHQEPVCLVCRDAEIHAGHTFRPLDEVAKDQKEELREWLQEAKELFNGYKQIRDSCNDQAMYIKVQKEQVENKIKKDFEELRHFLQIEEESKLSAVREDELKKSLNMKEKIKELNREMDALSDVIRTTEEQLMADHLSLTKNFQTAVTRIQKMPDRPQLLSEALLDEAKHVGNLKFIVWEKMKEMISYSPVILDPNTASPGISLSEDLTCLSFKDGEKRPMNPERFSSCDVLGSVLVSGTHTWDVDVGDNSDYRVGVGFQDPNRPGEFGTWRIKFHDDKYAIFGEPLGSWEPPVKLQRIQIHMDFNKRLFTFSDCFTKTELGKTKRYDWPDCSNGLKVFPYFSTNDKKPLKIIPHPLCVTVQSWS